jgi:hypothetical protein
MLKKNVLRTAAFLVAFTGIGFFGLVQCTRSNPIDPKSGDYIPNTPPEAVFAADTVSCLATDSVQFTVSFSDTQGLGGKTPAVTALYFSWDGSSDSAAMTDIVYVTGPGPVTITRAFPTARNVTACVRARDNDSMLGPAGTLRLIVTAGVLPEVNFIPDTVTGFVWDSIPVSVAWSDTQALGTKLPDVEMLYFNWFGNSASLNDSVSVAALADSTTVYKIFWLVLPNNKAYVRARDNDGNLSPLDSMWLTVDIGRPRLDSASASADTVTLGDSVTFTAAAHDTNAAAIRDFVWNVNGTDTITAAGVLRLLFMSEGAQTVTVRARDSDWVFSQPPDTMQVRVVDRNGPEIDFWSHDDGDTVSQLSPTITMMVRTRDPSGVLTVFINGATATKLVDTTWPEWQTWQMNITLTEGNNTVTAWAWDKSSGSNQTRDSIRIFYRRPDATPPNIVFSSPQPGDTLRDTLDPAPVTILVSVTDPSGVAWVRCNGTLMTNTSGNSYELDVSLAEGGDSLAITAQDVPGNGAVDTLNVTYLVIRDSTPPTLRIISPQEGRQIASDSVMVIALASDTGAVRSGVDSVTINGTRMPDTTIGGIVHYMMKVPLVHGYDTIVAAAVDSSGNPAIDTVIVVSNIAPQFYPNVSVKDTNLWLDTLSTIPVCASDPEGDAVTFSFLTMPLRSSTVPVIVPVNDTCANVTGYTPASVGLDTFRVRAVDAWGGADTLKVSVTIIRKPTTKPYFTISTLPDTAILDSLYSVQLTAEDPQGLTLAYALDYTVTPAGVSIDTVTGLVTWTPAALGMETIRAIVSNTIPESDTLEWYVTVVLPDVPPVLDTIPDTTIYEGQNLQFIVSASDTNGDALRYSFGASYPAGASLDSVTGIFTWTPTYKQARVHQVELIVTERFRNPALSDSMTFNITVRDTNIAPVIVGPGNKLVAEENSLRFTLQASDINGDSIRFSMTGLGSDAQLDSVSGLFTWVPQVWQAGVYPVIFIATDNGVPVLADSAFDTITVIDTTIPVFDPYPPMDTTLVGYPYIKVIHATDSTSDRMTYRKLVGPDSLVVNDSLGIIGWLPRTAGFQEIVPVSVIAEDHAGNSDTLSWLILVARWPRILLSPATHDTGFSVIETRGGGYAVCGTIADTAGGYSIGFFVRTDTSGNQTVPVKTYSGTGNRFSLYSMQQTPDDGFILCGSDVSGGTGGSKLALIRTDPLGEPLWTGYYSDMNGVLPSARGACVSLTSDNGFIACGTAIRGTGIPSLAPNEAYVVKVKDVTGGPVEWDRVYVNGTRASVLYSVREAGDGGFVMCGEIKEGMLNSNSDVYVIKTLPGRPDTLWTRFYNRVGSEVGLSVLPVVGAPEYLIGGYAANGNISAGILMKVVEGGDTLWLRTLPVNSFVASVRPTAEGDYIACGSGVPGGAGSSSGLDALLCRFTTNGTVSWLKFHGAGLNDGGFSVAAASDGGFIVSGFATTVLGGTTTDIYYAKTNRDGDLELRFGNIH